MILDPETGHRWVVLTDPEGNELGILRSTGEIAGH